MSKQGIFRKLSFLLALVMVMSSLCVPVLADTKEPDLLGSGDQYKDTRTGLLFEVSDGDGTATIVGPEDMVKNDLTIPQKVYGNNGTEYRVSSIGEKVFMNNSDLTGKLTITGGEASDSCIDVEKDAFANCTGLTSIVIGPYTTVLYDDNNDPFQGCTELKKIVNYSEEWNPGNVQDSKGRWVTTGRVKIPANNENKKWYDSKDTSKTTELSIVITGQTAIREDYTPPKYSVTFWDWDGDTEAYDYEYADLKQTVIEDERANEPDELTDPDWVFVAWFTDETLTNRYDFSQPVTSDLKLYAGWTKKAGSGKLFADENNSGLCFTINEDGKTATIARNLKTDPIDNSYTLIDENLVIPEVVAESNINYTVTGVGESAFEGKGYTGKLIFPDTLTDIGNRAFYNCTHLTGDLEFPDGLKTIGDSAFMMATNDSNLKGTIYLGTSLVSIGDSAFELCDGLNGDLIFPDTVESIGNNAFRGCRGFNGKLYLGKSLKTIGDFAFAGRLLTDFSHYTGGITIPATVISIGECAFYNAQDLDGELVIPLSGNLVNIGDKAFGQCSKLKGNLTFPQKLENIGDSAFIDCKALTGNVIIPDNVLYVGGAAFSSCSGLGETAVIGESVERIDKSLVAGVYMSNPTFAGCSGIKRVINKSDKVEVDLTQIVIRNESWTDAAGNVIKTIGKGVAYRSDYTGERIDPNDPNNPDGTVSGNKASDVKEEEVTVEGIEGVDKVLIIYPHKIPFFGKSKINVDYFTKDGGKFTVSFNQQEYAVKKIKVNKKKKKIQVQKLENADKKVEKAIKKATKGDHGLPYETTPYVVSDSDEVIVKFNKKAPDTIKSAKVKINNKFFNIKNKNECLVYNPVVSAVTFKHEDVIGSSTTYKTK